LAKPRVDIGLATNDIEPMLRFWQGEAGVPFDHLLPIRKGQDQHRHDANGSVLKINHRADPIPDAPPSGYVELLIAREGVEAPRELADPEGNRVVLVPPGWRGIGQVGIRLGVRDVAAHRRFYTEAFGLAEEPWDGGAAFRAGETLLIVEPSPDAPSDAGMQGRGWRYITFQVFKVDDEHARVVAAGGREAMAPTTLGTTARISMVRDPDGNWIELSQRASIVGSISPPP
ncbi:MAG: VOC family protein, partial [Caulobacteraceae bacterium]|nr:VOC family protein [Caulobacteraceae bacterium]